MVAINTTITEIARRTGPENAQEASTHEINKIYDRYCQFQDDTAFNWQKSLKRKGKLVLWK